MNIFTTDAYKESITSLGIVFDSIVVLKLAFPINFLNVFLHLPGIKLHHKLLPPSCHNPLSQPPPSPSPSLPSQSE